MMEFARKVQIASAALFDTALTVGLCNNLNNLRRSDLFAINSFCYAIASWMLLNLVDSVSTMLQLDIIHLDSISTMQYGHF